MEIADPSRFRSAYNFPHQHRATGVLAPFREILEAKPILFCLPISSTKSWCRSDRGLLKRKIPTAAPHRPPHATVACSPRLQPPSSRGPSPPLPDARRPPLLCIKALCCYAAAAAALRHVIPQVLAADCSQMSTEGN